MLFCNFKTLWFWRFCSIFETNYSESFILCWFFYHIPYINASLTLYMCCIAQVRVKKWKIDCFQQLLETWCLNFASRLFVIFNFCLDWTIYSLNVRCTSIGPRYLVWFWGVIFWPLRWNLGCLVIWVEWGFDNNYFTFANVWQDFVRPKQFKRLLNSRVDALILSLGAYQTQYLKVQTVFC